MTNPTGYPVIDEILESIAPARECTCHKFIRLHDSNCDVHGLVRKQPLALSQTGAEINARLDDLAHDLCYQSIRWSGLYKELTNDQWDALAERLRAQVRMFIEGEINAELTRIEEAESPSRDSETVET